MNVSMLGALGALVAAAGAIAQPITLRVTAENLSPTNSVSFAPLRLGFGNGTFDSFNNGEVASPGIVSIAEGGSGAAWFPAFGAAEPNATLGTVVPMPAGPLLPGASATGTFVVDPSVNRFFSFGSMVVPSNDYFIGNDNPMQYMLFDALGALNLSTIELRAGSIWDAGSEVDGVFGAAFLVGSSNDDRIADDDVAGLDFQDLGLFNGLETAAGYIFNLQLSASDPVYRISFEVVPAPGCAALLGFAALGASRRRRGA